MRDGDQSEFVDTKYAFNEQSQTDVLSLNGHSKENKKYKKWKS